MEQQRQRAKAAGVSIDSRCRMQSIKWWPITMPRRLRGMNCQGGAAAQCRPYWLTAKPLRQRRMAMRAGGAE